jgi:hypothetical protein
MAVTLGFLRISEVSLVRSQGWNSISGLSSTKSNSRRVPLTNDVTLDQRDQPVGEHLAVHAELVLVAEAFEHRVGDRTDAHLQRGAVLDERGHVLPDLLFDLTVLGGRGLVQWPVAARERRDA